MRIAEEQPNQCQPDTSPLRPEGNRSSDIVSKRAQCGASAIRASCELHDLLSYSVEVQEAATRAQIRELAAFTVCPPHKRELEDMTEEGVYQEQILKKRISMLDLLEQYESCEMPFERFLELLRPLKPRYYSISSSPRVNPEQASITVGVVRGPAWSGRGEYRGVSSSYLAERQAGDDVVMFVRTPESRFQLRKTLKPQSLWSGRAQE